MEDFKATNNETEQTNNDVIQFENETPEQSEEIKEKTEAVAAMNNDVVELVKENFAEAMTEEKISAIEAGNKIVEESFSAAAASTKPKKQKPEVKSSYEKMKEKGVLAATIRFQGEEAEHIKKIIDERIAAGYTEDNTHFIRQCVDFAINFNFVFNQKVFGLPDNTKKLLLKKGYFNQSK